MTIRILIADDHAVLRSGLKALFQGEPDLHVVGEASTGEEAIDMLQRIEADVLILDLVLPRMSGCEVAGRLRVTHPKLGIVVLTMHEDPFYLRKAFGLGVRGFVPKSAASRDLIEAIRVVHAGGQYADPSIAASLISTSAASSGKEGSTATLDALSAREREVCELLALGHTNSEIGEVLHLSARTVEGHRASLMTKLGISTRAELVRFALQRGILSSR